MNLEQTERLLEQLHGQLDNAIEKGARDTARYLYGQIAGALMLALYLRIIDEQENDRRYRSVFHCCFLLFSLPTLSLRGTYL